MSKWEDIVKDKLEGYESKLPEGSLAEFRALRAGTGNTRPKRRSPVVWATAAAVAAGLAAILFFRQPTGSEKGIQIVELPAAPVAIVEDTPEVEEPAPVQQLIAQTVKPKVVSKRVESVRPAETPQTPQTTEPVEVAEPIEDKVVDTVDETIQPEVSSPFIPDYAEPQYTEPREVKVKIVPVAGAIAGGGLLAAVAVPLLKGTLYDEATAPISSEFSSGNPNRPNSEPITHAAHHFPLKTGLSVRIPVAERLKITTGLEYSRYRSEFTYETSGLKKQTAHYLGVPVRLDWTLTSGRWLDAYVGAGVSGDKCFAAYRDGKPYAKDPFAFSLLGAGGIQLNFTKRLGLYVEPEVSWVVPWQPRMLQTYRSENPVMFSVATGLRINLGK